MPGARLTSQREHRIGFVEDGVTNEDGDTHLHVLPDANELFGLRRRKESRVDEGQAKAFDSQGEVVVEVLRFKV